MFYFFDKLENLSQVRGLSKRLMSVQLIAIQTVAGDDEQFIRQFLRCRVILKLRENVTRFEIISQQEQISLANCRKEFNIRCQLRGVSTPLTSTELYLTNVRYGMSGKFMIHVDSCLVRMSGRINEVHFGHRL